MEKKFTIILFFALCHSVTLQARKFIINCSFKSICPITIYAQGNTYYLTEARRTDTEGPAAVIIYTEGNRDLNFSAYDKDGNRITQITRNNKTDNQGNIEYTRIELGGTISWKKAESTDYNSYGGEDFVGEAPEGNFSDNGYGGLTDRKSPVEQALSSGIDQLTNTVNNIGSRVGDIISTGPKIAGYPNLSLNLGMSRLYGEYARLKVCWGSYAGFYMQGGVGKDWVWKGDNREKISWHAGIGYYISPAEDEDHEITLGVSYVQTPVVEGGALNLDLGYTYYLPATNYRLGFFGGAGLGIGNLKAAFATKEGEKFGGVFVWDVSVGISVKIFASKTSSYY